MLRITADMFSGRPNPSWEADEDEAGNLLREIARNKSAVGAIADGDQGLGYRGLIVEALADNVASKHGLPDTFRIGHNGEASDLVGTLAGSMLKAQVLDRELHGFVVQEAQRLGSRADATEPDTSAAPAVLHAGGEEFVARSAAVTCYIELGAFNPGFWNDPYHVIHNNCYNYASNRRTDTFAQPGRATGHQATTMACSNVTAAALSDGLHHRYDCFPDSEKPRWLMALVVAPGWDYHWYRKQKEGFWGHKPGGTPARNYDNNHAIVWNPETCARLPYTNFCGYFYACKSQKIN
jgi:hypothetical protein